jgi:ABC-2 type transport system ATP-binding protein
VVRCGNDNDSGRGPAHNVIDVRNLIFEYPGQRAIDDVSFSIERDSVTALVGPNGAGKTTLMRCLCALERPLSGSIAVDGIDVIEHPRRSHERIGYLSDFFGLYDELSVRQCLRYAAQAYGVTQNLDESIARTCERLHLADRAAQRVGELSRGLRQRVAIGQAMIHEPRVLVLDEPASGLDPEARHDLAELFKNLQLAGMTLLVSSHILAELEAYASDMLVIREGRIVEQRKLKPARTSLRTLVIEVAAGAAHVESLLSRHREVQSVVTDGNRLTCELSGGEETQLKLLKFLVGQGAAIINYTTTQPDLQRSYLESIKGQRTL